MGDGKDKGNVKDDYWASGLWKGWIDPFVEGTKEARMTITHNCPLSTHLGS